ncbi:MAG: MCP four helix bundle domain-containing protein [Massilia sp.]
MSRWLGRLRIGPKLLLAPSLVLVLLIVSLLTAWYALVRQNQSLEIIVQVRAARIKEATALVNAVQAAHVRSYRLLTGIGGSFSTPRNDALALDIAARQLALQQAFARLLRHSAGVERDLLLQSERAHDQYVAAIGDVLELARGDASIGANAMAKAERAFDRVTDCLARLAALEQGLSETAAQEAAAEFQVISIAMPVLVLVSTVLSLAVSMLVRAALLREIDAIGEAARDLANGDLRARERAYGHDEIADTTRSLDAGIVHLNHTLRQVLDAAQAIEHGARAMSGMVSVVPLDQVSAHHSALVAEAALAAGSLQQQALSLSQAVAGIQLDAPPVAPLGKAHLRLAAKRD